MLMIARYSPRNILWKNFISDTLLLLLINTHLSRDRLILSVYDKPILAADFY